MTTIEIKNRFTSAVLFALEYESFRACLESVVLSGANLSWTELSGANLSGANLSGANLYGANLDKANLSEVNLYGAELSGANLSEVNLYGANLDKANLSWTELSGANLYKANLSGADLSGAILYGANLYKANLDKANLSEVNLSWANLSGANLYGVNLDKANLSEVKDAELIIARTRILPAGDIIGWKKCGNGAIVKMLIPATAKRSHAFGRKCRAEYAEVLEIIGEDVVGVTNEHGPHTEYRVGDRVVADKWDSDWTKECSHGIHFFITEEEARNW